MAFNPSQYLTPREAATFNRIGDILMPGEDGFPSFSELGCIEHIDDVVAYTGADDRAALKTLLTLLSVFPTPLLRAFLALVALCKKLPGGLGALFRLLDMGLRSVVVTLYFSGKTGGSYSGKSPLDLIDYHLNPVR